MTNTPNMDPVEMWRQFVNQFESNLNSMANNSMSSEQFTHTLQKFSEVSTGVQQIFGKVLDAYFKALHMTSRNDVLALGEKIQRLEDKIDILLQEREPMESPPRTRQPFNKSDACTDFDSTLSGRLAMTSPNDAASVSIADRMQIEIDRTIQRNLKGLSFLGSPDPAVGTTPKAVLGDWFRWTFVALTLVRENCSCSAT